MAGFCLAAYLGAAWITADVSPLRPDTPSYLYFDPSRSIGYPLFLWISRQLGGAVLAVPLQMLVLTISLFFLGLAFFKYTGRPVLSVLFQLGLVLSPEMWKFAAMLLTEATATAAVALWCAQLLRTVRAPDSRSIGFLTVISGVATLVKPSLAPLFIGATILVLGQPSWKQRGWALALIAAGLTTTLAVTPIANLFLHGSTDSGSPVARGVLQHTLFCSVSKPPADPDSAFVERYARAVTNYISAAPRAVHADRRHHRSPRHARTRPPPFAPSRRRPDPRGSCSRARWQSGQRTCAVEGARPRRPDGISAVAPSFPVSTTRT